MKYAGFISYAHKNEVIAARLHKALETFNAPKTLQIAEGKTLKPIFRDAAELTAHHSLSEKIRDAVQNSNYLIVLCSPAAKASHWVNEEIRLFRQLHGEGSILCALVEGDPQTSFPPALLEGGREPLAANLSKPNFKLGTLQIAASMLGVGLDSLVQRDNQRRKRRSQAITAAALLFSGVMGTTAFMAIEARNEAQENRAQAEGLVEYMITDLRDKLEPVGRLDLLGGVGDRAVQYYDAQEIKRLSDESLSRQARARHILGQVALDQGDPDKADHEINAAAKLTAEILNRNPDDTDAIFAHAQSEYWVGRIEYNKKDYRSAMPYWKKYNALAEKLVAIDPEDINWVLEKGYSENGLGKLEFELLNYPSALIYYQSALKHYEKILHTAPTHQKTLSAMANNYAGVARAYRKMGIPSEEKKYRLQQIEIYNRILNIDSENQSVFYNRTLAQARILTSELIDKDTSEYQELLSEVNASFEKLISEDPTNQRWRRIYTGFQNVMKTINGSKPD